MIQKMAEWKNHSAIFCKALQEKPRELIIYAIPLGRISVFSVVAAAANYDNNCKYDDPSAVVIKDVA